MMSFEEGLYVRVEECEVAPPPKPLKSGFSLRNAYRVLGITTASETAEAYFILSNDRREVWFISNRHVRVVGLQKKVTLTSIPLPLIEEYGTLSLHQEA